MTVLCISTVDFKNKLAGRPAGEQVREKLYVGIDTTSATLPAVTCWHSTVERLALRISPAVACAVNSANSGDLEKIQ